MKKNILRIVAAFLVLTLIMCLPVGGLAFTNDYYFPDATVGIAYEEHVSVTPDPNPGHPLEMRDPIPDVPGLNCNPEGDEAYILGTPTAAGDYVYSVGHRGVDDIISLHIKVKPAQAATTVLQNQISSEPHVHSFKWETSKEPTETEDGEMIYVCQDKDCREVALTEKTTGQSIFMINTANKILKAEQNAVLHISTTHWKSFNKTVLYAMLKRPDVTYVLDFLSEGHKGDPMTVTIPAGFDVESFFDKDGWAGFLFINDVINRYNMAHNN